MVSLHWARITTKAEPAEVLEAVRRSFGGDFVEVIRGRFNVDQGVNHETGLSVHTPSRPGRQPSVIEIPGQACERVTVDAVLDCCSRVDGAMSRVDLACDVAPASESRARVLAMRDAWRAGDVETRMHRESLEWYENDGDGQGCTLYVGGRKSELRMRAYDRRGDLRIEWEIKMESQSMRRALPLMLRDNGLAPVWRWASRGVLFTFPWYRSLLDGPVAESRGGRDSGSGVLESLASLQYQRGPLLRLLGVGGLDLAKLGREPSTLSKQNRHRYDVAIRELERELKLDGEAMRRELASWR